MKTNSLPPVFSTILLALSLLKTGDLSAQSFNLEVPEANKGVFLKSVDVSVEIVGSFALTTTELVFRNPNNRQLEGTLEFPLLDGQSVVRFAMDVNGSLREAVPVEKEKGQQVFEAIERRRVDPGLVEKTKGNHYRARIFPILPMSDKRVILSTIEDLASSSEKPVYRLALNYGQVEKLGIQVAMKSTEQGPAVDVQGLSGLHFSDWGKDWVTTAVASNIQAIGLVEIPLPQRFKSRVLTQSIGDETWFYTPFSLPEFPRQEAQPPRSLALYWDSSSSAASQDFEKINQFLDALFSLYPELDVSLIRVRNEIEAPLAFKVRKSDWKDLKLELWSTRYDGATLQNFGISGNTSDLVLVVSDGVRNWGDSTSIPKITGRLYSVLATTSADPSYLRSLAQKNGGDLINLLFTAPEQAIDSIRYVSPVLAALDYHPQEMSQLSMSAGSIISAGSGISGILRSDSAKLSYKIRLPDGRFLEQLLHLSKSDSQSRSDLPGKIWATQRIQSLQLDADNNLQEIRRIGQQFGIVTDGTSLIILDAVEDYVQYGIEPPSELKAAYNQLLSTRANEQKTLSHQHLDSVYQRWMSEREWYLKKWPKGEPPSLEKEEKQAGRPSLMGALGGVRREAADSDRELAVQAFASEPEMTGAGESNRMELSDRVLADMEVPSPAPAPDDSGNDGVSATISLQAWKPDSAYAEQISKKEGIECYRTYLEYKPEYERSTAFYLDVFDILQEKGLPELALRVLSNLAEMQLENHSILRILGYRLMQVDQNAFALPVFETILRLRPEEPQSYRDLALVQQSLGNHQAAVDLYWTIIQKPWDDRFPDVELIALYELNALLATSVQQLGLSGIEDRFIEPMPLDLRVVLTWDADNTDIDLWVTDPNGETCKYDHALTYQGGKMSRDFTRGYGPEVFSLKSAKPGIYKVEANYYGNSQQILSGATTIQLSLQDHFGSPQMESKSITLRLKDQKEVVFVGTFEVKK